MTNFNIQQFKEENYPFLNKISSGDTLICRYKNLLNLNLDFDVFLSSFGVNLQRDFVWELYQKQEFILSIFKGIRLPPVSVIVDDTEGEEKNYLIIDGKQRIKTIIDFLKNDLYIEIKNKKILFDNLDTRSKSTFLNYDVLGYILYSNSNFDPVSDLQKIQWFNYINFAGTPQDKKHQEKLQNFLKTEKNKI